MLMGALCRALRNSSVKGELKDRYIQYFSFEFRKTSLCLVYF